MPSGYETRARSSSSKPLLQVLPSSVETKADMLERRGNRTSIGPFFTSSKLPDASRRMKNRALQFLIDDGSGGVHVAPLSDEKLSAMPYFVRASIHKRPSLSSTIMCSSNSVSGKATPPRRVQVWP